MYIEINQTYRQQTLYRYGGAEHENGFYIFFEYWRLESWNYAINHRNRFYAAFWILWRSFFLRNPVFKGSYDDDTLKWKSHDTTNANTIQARRKFRKRWPCQKLRDSEAEVDAEIAAIVDALFDSFVCSASSISLAPATFCAIDWQISHVLIIINCRSQITFEGEARKTNFHLNCSQ